MHSHSSSDAFLICGNLARESVFLASVVESTPHPFLSATASRAVIKSPASPTPSKATSTSTFEARGLPPTTASPSASAGGR